MPDRESAAIRVPADKNPDRLQFGDVELDLHPMTSGIRAAVLCTSHHP